MKSILPQQPNNGIMQDASANPTVQFTLTMRGYHWFVLGLLTALLLVGGITACYQGRDISRVTGRAVHVDLPADLTGYDKIVSISFHKNSDGETLKDITYLSTDGKLHSKEYNDWGIFQGEIIWELAGE